METWKALDRNQNYEVSSYGRVRERARPVFNRGRVYSKPPRQIEPFIDPDGYAFVVIRKPLGTGSEKIFVNRLVIEVFENGALTHVYGGSGAGNTWTFTIGVSTAPAYDSPCSAIEITADGPSLTLNNTDAIAGFGELAPAGVDCGVYGFWCEGNSTNSIWAKFIPTTNATSFEVTTCNPGTSTDTQIAIYKVSDCSNFATFDLISSNEDRIGGCSA